MNKLTKTIALSALSLAVAARVQSQGAPQQWVLVTTIETGDQIFMDLASQVRLFDTGVKTNTFRTVTNSPGGKPLRGVRYQADCFKGTLALQGVEMVDAQGSPTRQLSLTSLDRTPAVPTKNTVAAEIWRYACSQF
jgi:hypothetical protein